MDTNKVDKILAAQVEKNRTPSVHYVIFNEDHLIHESQFGYADLENQKKLEQETTFKAHSVTKTFTALCILQLAEKKRLNIDEPIIRYLPDFPYSSDITIRQLMAHSAGIPNPNPLAWIHLEEEHDTFNSDSYFKSVFAKHKKVKSKPNEKFAYTNLGYVFLGQLIAKVSGQDYGDYVRDHIIRVLGVSSKEMDFKVQDKNQHAKGYQKRMTALNLALGFFIDKSKYMDKAKGKWRPFKNLYVNGAPYGGLIGNPNAFVTYIQELLKPDCSLVSGEYKELLFTENRTNSNKATGMCLSWFTGELKGHRFFDHAGGGGGYYCELRMYPELGIGSVIMFNRTGIRNERFLDQLDKHFIKSNNIKPLATPNR